MEKKENLRKLDKQICPRSIKKTCTNCNNGWCEIYKVEINKINYNCDK